MRRIGLYCFFDKEGIVDKDVLYILRDLKKSLSYLIVIVNGKLLSEDVFDGIADKVIRRDNKGLDAGAFKTAMFQPDCQRMIEQCDELVLCNSSFYGPLVSFDSIFASMADKNADFWGLTYRDLPFFRFIASFFIVYRKKVLSDRAFWQYWADRIDENTEDYYTVVIDYENGLFEFLVERNYKYATYAGTLSGAIFENPGRAIMIDKLPILKKRFFSERYYNPELAANILTYIEQNYDYDVGMIKQSAARLYSVAVESHLNQIDYELMENTQKYEQMEYITKEMMFEYVSRHRNLYIYGAGAFGQIIVTLMDKAGIKGNIKGFIVSDGQRLYEKQYKEIPIYYLSEITDKKVPILLALSTKNAREVQGKLKDFENVYYLWKTGDR